MNGLEALEIVKYECGFAFGMTANGDRVRKSFPIIEKELKAFEIIKKKEVNVAWFTYVDNLEDYNKGKFIGSYLTQDEFDLLKEVMK